MVNVFLYEDFRMFLIDEYQRRKLRNRRYSLRAFARDIQMSFSRLSEIFSRGGAITATSGLKISDNLGMSDQEKDYFVNLIRAQYARTADERKKAKNLVARYKTKKIYVQLRENYSGLLTHWYYPALIELVTLRNALTETQIARILKLPPAQVAASILHLKDLGYIERESNGTWKKPKSHLKIESATPSSLIRQAHRKTLACAHKAIEKQPIAQRKYLSSYFSVRKESIAEARLELERLSADFLSRYAAEKNADAVYCFSLQLFTME